MSELRCYLLTMKASFSQYKGDEEMLMRQFLLYLARIATEKYEYNVEDEGTNNVHIHAIVYCPYIADKARQAKKSFGYRIFNVLQRKGTEEKAVTQYQLYINKEKSDSEKIYKIYGNLFEEFQ